jgi:hypothetical protein
MVTMLACNCARGRQNSASISKIAKQGFAMSKMETTSYLGRQFSWLRKWCTAGLHRGFDDGEDVRGYLYSALRNALFTEYLECADLATDSTQLLIIQLGRQILRIDLIPSIFYDAPRSAKCQRDLLSARKGLNTCCSLIRGTTALELKCKMGRQMFWSDYRSIEIWKERF